MKIKALIENKSCDPKLKPEHGLSIYIDTGTTRLVIDTGESGDFLENAEKMGVEIETVDSIIATHSHADHTGGLIRLLEKNRKAKLYMSRYADQKLFYKIAFLKRSIETPEKVFTTYKERINFVDNFLELDKDVFLVSGFANKYPIPATNKKLYALSNNSYIRDTFNHELAVVLKNSGKLVIITGCSHNGVDNMIEEVQKYFPGYPIQTVIGGFHLMSFVLPKYLGEKKKNIINLGERLLDYNIEKTYTCHCTGDRGFNILKDVMGTQLQYLKTGDEIEL